MVKKQWIYNTFITWKTALLNYLQQNVEYYIVWYKHTGVEVKNVMHLQELLQLIYS